MAIKRKFRILEAPSPRRLDTITQSPDGMETVSPLRKLMPMLLPVTPLRETSFVRGVKHNFVFEPRMPVRYQAAPRPENAMFQRQGEFLRNNDEIRFSSSFISRIESNAVVGNGSCSSAR